jgi:hypothetical protein
MSFGLTFTNNNDVVTLDSEFARLVVLHKGSWTNGGGGAGVSFPSVITSSDPPLVFVRPSSSCTMCFCLINGSPGAWTGFSFSGIAGQAYSGTYFAAAFKASPVGTFGLRLWDGASKLLFDSSNPCAKFTKTITSWTYLGSSPTSQGASMLSWTAYTPLNTGEFMLINNIAMDVAGGTSRQGNQYAVWDYGNNRLVMQVVGVDIQTTLYTPIVWAKPIS